MTDSKNDFNIVVDDEKISLTLKQLDQKDLEAADREHASKIAELIRSGGNKDLLFRQELDDYLRKMGVWSQEDDKEINRLQKQVAELIGKLKKGGIKLSEGRNIAIKISEKRQEMIRIRSKRQIFDDRTIESLADEARIDFLVFSAVVHKEDGQRYWDTLDDLKKDKYSEPYQKGLSFVYEKVFGYDNKFEQRLPENKWLKKYKFVDDELNLTDRKTGEFVDKDGNFVNEQMEELQEQYEILTGDISEETPFIDDDTNTPVIPENSEVLDDVEKVEEKDKKTGKNKAQKTEEKVE